MSACAGLLLLAAAELALRWSLAPTPLESVLSLLREDAELFWTGRPHARARFFGAEVELDALGLRRRPSPPSGSEGPRLRVLCLGASPTFGWGVAAESAYPALLERGLREAGLGAEVRNGGVIGYSSHQGLTFLRRHWETLRPDIVTIPFVINDVDAYRFLRNDGRPDRLAAPAGASARARTALERLALFRALERLLAPGGSAPPGALRVPPEDYARNLRALAAFARARGARVVFVGMPVNLPSEPRGPLPYSAEAGGALPRGRHSESESRQREAARCSREALAYHALMARVARELGVPFVDLPAAFARAAPLGAPLFLTARGDSIHPSEAGHALIARELAPVLAALARVQK